MSNTLNVSLHIDMWAFILKRKSEFGSKITSKVKYDLARTLNYAKLMIRN